MAYENFQKKEKKKKPLNQLFSCTFKLFSTLI